MSIDFRTLFDARRPGRFRDGGPVSNSFLPQIEIAGKDRVEPAPFVWQLTNDGATVSIDSTGLTVLNGFLTLQDEFGKTVLGSSGFDGSWFDFLSSGLYNGLLLAGTVGTIPNGRTSALPYFTLANVAGLPTATFVSGGGVDVTFSALNDIKGFTADRVAVSAQAFYHLTYQVQATKGVPSMFLILRSYIDWFKSDGTAASTATTTLAENSFTATSIPLDINTLEPVRPPDNARYAKVRFEVVESAIGSHSTGHKLNIKSVSFKALPQAGGLTFPSGTRVNSSDRFFRTDLDMEFFWDGNRWLSTQLFVQEFGRNRHAGDWPISLNVTDYNRMQVPDLQGGSDIWLVSHKTTFFVVSGGTALGALHKWVGNVTKFDSAAGQTTIATVNIDSGSSAVYRTIVTSIGALLNNGTTRYIFATDWTKTGTPGDLHAYESLTYRIVAT